MSLVNDMLRDLDQRREKPAAEPEIPLTASASAGSARRTRWPLLALVVLLGGGLAGWLLLNPAPPPVPHSITFTPPPTPVASAAPPVATQLPLLPAVALPEDPRAVTAVDWSRDGQAWLLTLTTAGEASFRLRQIDSRELRLTLPQSQLSAALPSSPDPLIERFSLTPAADALELRLVSREVVNYQVYPLHGEAGDQLQIRLEARAPAPPAAPPASVPAAKPKAAPPKAVASAPKPAAVPVAPLQKSVRLSLAQRDRQASSDALTLVRKGRNSDAINRLQGFVDSEPAALESRTLLATLLLAERRNREATRLIDEGLVQAPQDAALRKLKARLLIAAGQPPQAAALLADNPPALERDPEYFQLKAAAEQAGGDHQAASRSYHALLQHDATNPAWWIGLGISLEALQQPLPAREAYRNVLQIPRAPANLSAFARARLQHLGG